jgi:DNA topoisomerase-2
MSKQPDCFPIVNDESCESNRYQKKSPLEHILDLPDTYIGSVEIAEEDMFILNDENKMVKKTISYIPGLQRIYEEILLNAFDQQVREGTGVTQLKVAIDQKEGVISVMNDGKGIPIIMHNTYKVWIPEMIFGELLTSSNYGKGEKRITGGKNGYGAKLANIFSDYFIVETVDEERQKKFKIKFTKNMSKKGKASVTKFTGKPYTKITFKPDLNRFKIENLTDEIVALMKRRTYDIAATTRPEVSVYYNKTKIPIKKFEDYMKLYNHDGRPMVTEICNERWTIGAMLSDDNFEQVSFVNGIDTNQGGTHVDYIANQLVKEVVATLKKKNANVKNSYVKDKMFIFVKSAIENPAFNSQTKQHMTSRVKTFGSTCSLSTKFVKGFMKTGILDEVLAFAKFKENKAMKKTDGKKAKKLIGIPKLDDANMAGTKYSGKCMLIVTEGDSAKTFATAGLSKIGRDYYGIFPLKGKMLNVKNASSSQVRNNAEMNNLKQIIGLKQDTEYADVSELRYGGVVVLTDQDVDGAHIKGLFMNWIHTYWPSLIKLGFIKSLATPILKAYKGKQVINFFTESDYRKWKAVNNNGKGWKTKYFKGLGTSDAKDAKESFTDFLEKLIHYEQDNNTNEHIKLAFNKEQADARKEWLLKYNSDEIIEQSEKNVNISDFVDKELKHFSYDDIQRSIPNVVDGLKPTQRKILFAGLKRHMTNKSEIKVSQFANQAAEVTDYHHGESSVVSTVVNMAQNYVGSNNVNLFLPNGQFGSRLQGGKDSASARYIFTNVAPMATAMFKNEDNPLYKYVDSDGTIVEPEHYVPVIPNVLINGATGIGTGFSTTVLPHSLEDVVNNIRARLDGKKGTKMNPHYRGFTGKIEKVAPGKYETYGKFEINEEKRQIIITELPIGLWTDPYKEYLNLLIDDKSNMEIPGKLKGKQFIDSIENHSTEFKPKFVLNISKKNFEIIKQKSETYLANLLKMTSKLSENNMYMFDKNGQIRKFKTPEEIIDYFYGIRLEFYQKRKDFLIKELQNTVELLEAKYRFIKLVNEEKIKILRKTNEEVEKQLEKYKLPRLAKNADSEKSYDYLINMPIRSLTNEKARQLEEEFTNKNTELNKLIKTDIKDMWRKDLDILLKLNTEYNNVLGEMMDEVVDKVTKTTKKGRKKPAPKKKATKKTTKKSKQ